MYFRQPCICCPSLGGRALGSDRANWQQRFHADDPTRIDLDQGLVVEDELFQRQREAQVVGVHIVLKHCMGANEDLDISICQCNLAG